MSAPVPAAHRERAIWWAALACFVLAALTGALMRFGMVGGLPWGLELGNVRHAHSHLMFFSWVTPLLMAFAATLGRPARYRRTGYFLAWLALVTGLLTYLPFLLSGYGRLELFGRELPLSMMAAGPAGIAWYGFVVYHFVSARGRTRTVPLRALDGAALNLLLASVAVTFVPVVMFAGLGTEWRDGLIAVFLESFGEGWFALALLGLAYASIFNSPEAEEVPTAVGGGRTKHLGVALLTAGILVRSVARLIVATGGAWAQLPALFATIAASAGLLLLVIPLLRHLVWPGGVPHIGRTANRGLWLVPLGFLLLKALADPLLSVPALSNWMAGGMRILFLHAFLLGSVSLGLVALTATRLGRQTVAGANAFGLTVLLMIAALVPLTPLWPAVWSGPWILQVAAWTSLGPPVVAVFMLSVRAVHGTTTYRNTTSAGTESLAGGTGHSGNR